MSAYIVDPRTIDYLVAWAQRHHSQNRCPRATVPRSIARADLPACLEGVAGPGDPLYLVQLTGSDLGAILMAENVRSVRARYPDDAPDNLPGPCDQRRVWGYRAEPIPLELNPAWVVKAADCLEYQSCESDDWRETLAYAVLEAIREDAIAKLTVDAPWGVTDDDITKAQDALKAKRAEIYARTMAQLRGEVGACPKDPDGQHFVGCGCDA